MVAHALWFGDTHYTKFTGSIGVIGEFKIGENVANLNIRAHENLLERLQIYPSIFYEEGCADAETRMSVRFRGMVEPSPDAAG